MRLKSKRSAAAVHPRIANSLLMVGKVNCGAGHYWCFDCLLEPHEPCSCESPLIVWVGSQLLHQASVFMEAARARARHCGLLPLDEARAVRGQAELKEDEIKFDKNTVPLSRCLSTADQLVWIGENTKPCPKCRVSIEKNHGAIANARVTLCVQGAIT